MKAAVVIPVFNHARFVVEAIDSVLAQTRRPDRILVIDDGSSDNSLDVCRRFEPRGVEVFAQQNQGAHASINRGVVLAAADCEVIAILNSDDRHHSDRIAKTLGVLAADPSAAVVASKLRYIDDAGEPLPDDHPRGRWLRAVWSRWGESDLDFAEWIGQANFVVTSSNIVARREFLLAYPFKPYRFNHDYYFLAQAAIRGVLRLVPEPLIDYRVHPANTINTSPAPLMRELLLQNFELFHDLAGDLAADPGLRSRFQRYARGLWDNVSALHAGVLHAMLAQSVAGRDFDGISRAIRAMNESEWPELSQYPNKEVVNSFDGTNPFRGGSGRLAEKFSTARTERDDAREKAAAWRELARLRARLLGSRWVALGRWLGAARGIECDDGRTPQEKLENLRSAIRRSWWMRPWKWDG
jgi:glycosyltransferase involved in cell wall biosynthesis